MNFPLKGEGPLSGKRLKPRGFVLPKEAYRLRLYLLLGLTDGAGILAAFVLASLTRSQEVFGANGLNLAAMVLPLYWLIAVSHRAYDYQVLVNWKTGISNALGALIFAVAAVLFVAFYAKSSLAFSRLVYGVGSVGAALFLVLGRYVFKRLIGPIADENLRAELVIVDGGELPNIGGALVIDASEYGLRPDVRDPHMLDRLGKAVRGAEYVLICCAPERRAAWALLLKGADVQGYVIAPEFDEVGANRLSRYHGHCVMQVASGPLDLRSRIIKRSMDLSFTVLALLCLFPLLILVAVAIKVDSKGPVFFRQQRMGRGNRLFSMIKFRSMRTSDSDAEGAQSTCRQDTRVTRVGRFIRATSIDELPQLLNVLRGDMSLVGPRPHALGSTAGAERFWEIDQRYWHRHALKPGITGLAQVRGLRGATLERDDLVKRLQADLEYLNGWTVWRDLTILFATISVIIHPRAY